MADAERSSKAVGSQIPPATRLKSQAPASIEIKRASNWHVVIPLLTPLVSPSSCAVQDQEALPLMMAENKAARLEMAEKGPTFTKWQHPAAPFYYGPLPRATPFVPV